MADAIQLSNLQIHSGEKVLVHGVSLTLAPGELVGLVGASGSGKTLTCRSLLGLVDLDPGVVEGELTIPGPEGPVHPYRGTLGAGRRRRDRAFRPVRGSRLGYLPQHAKAALDPLVRVGRQVATSAGGPPHDDPVPWLVRAGFPAGDAPRVAQLYPHQLSGGMAQRVAIAQVLALGAPFLVADEPTTGLDAPIQRALVEQLRDLTREEGLGVLLVTHDLPLLSYVADRVLLMDGGRIGERWSADDLRQGRPSTEAGRRLLAAARRRAW